MYDEVEAGIDPLSPENKLIFATGTSTGTLVPNKGHCLIFKSPLTGVHGYASSGGLFGAELKQAGYDVLTTDSAANVIEGAIEIVLGILLAGSIAAIFAAFPLAIVGAMMFLVAISKFSIRYWRPRCR